VLASIDREGISVDQGRADEPAPESSVAIDDEEGAPGADGAPTPLDIAHRKSVLFKDAQIPADLLPELLRYESLLDEYAVFGDEKRHAGRIQPISTDLFMVRQGGLPPAGRTTPETVDRHLLRGFPESEREDVVTKLWDLMEAENGILAHLSTRTQQLIDGKVETHQADRAIVCVEVRSGQIYVVRRGEDPEVDRVLGDLAGLGARRAALIEPYLPHQGEK